MAVLIVAFWGVLFLALLDSGLLVREAALAAATATGVGLLAVTEALSLPGALTPAGLALAWLVAVGVAVASLRRRVGVGARRARREVVSALERAPRVPAAIVALFVAGTFAAGVLYPPYNWDSLTYHLPRVHLWLQNGSVAHFPTAEARQLFSSPFANYVVLHLQALSGGGDRLIDLGQWWGYLLSATAVSLLARRLGASAHGQWLAAVVALTVPMAVLQASTTQNDLFTAAWCLVGVYAVVVVIDRLHDGHPRALATPWLVWAAAAGGLALQSKPTAILVLAPFGAWFIVTLVGAAGWRRSLGTLGLMVACVLVVNSAWYLRNAATLDGDFLGLQAPGNDHILTAARTPTTLAANGLMNASMLLGTPSTGVNERTEAAVERIAAVLGVTELESVMGEPGYGPYQVRREIWSHDIAPAPLTVALFVISAVALMGRGSRPGPLQAVYPAAAFAGFVLMLALIGWQPWINRLTLPAVLLMAPLAGPALTEATARGRRAIAPALLAGVALSVVLGLLVLAFDYSNRLVPMAGSRWFASYEESRFRAVPDLEQPLRAVIAGLEARGIERVGISQHDGDFPIQLLFSVAADVEFGYVVPTVLPERIGQRGFTPEAVVVIVGEERFQASPARYVPASEELIEPQQAAGWVILLHDVR